MLVDISFAGPIIPWLIRLLVYQWWWSLGMGGTGNSDPTWHRAESRWRMLVVQAILSERRGNKRHRKDGSPRMERYQRDTSLVSKMVIWDNLASTEIHEWCCDHLARKEINSWLVLNPCRLRAHGAGFDWHFNLNNNPVENMLSRSWATCATWQDLNTQLKLAQHRTLETT